MHAAPRSPQVARGSKHTGDMGGSGCEIRAATSHAVTKCGDLCGRLLVVVPGDLPGFDAAAAAILLRSGIIVLVRYSLQKLVGLFCLENSERKTERWMD